MIMSPSICRVLNATTIVIYMHDNLRIDVITMPVYWGVAREIILKAGQDPILTLCIHTQETCSC